MFSGHIVAKLLNFLLIILLTRIFSKEDFGIFSYSLAFTSMFMIFCNLGLNTLAIRDIAKDRSCSKAVVEEMFPIIVYLSLLSLGIMNGIAWLTGWSAYDRSIILMLSFYVVFDAFSRSFISIIRAFERMEYEAVIYISERIFLIVITLFVGYLHLSLLILVSTYMIFEFIKTLISLIIVKKKLIRFSVKFYSRNAILLLKEAIPFALMAIFTTISMRIDTVMIKIYHSPELAGIYTIAHRIIESLTFIPENIYNAFFPVVASLFLINKTKFNLALKNAFRINTILAIPVVCILLFRANDIIALIFKPEFYKAASVLKWLALAMFAIFLKYALAVFMNVAGKQKIFSFYIGLSMVLNIVLNLFLIPKYDLIGAGLATFASELLTAILGFLSLRGALSFNILSLNLLRYITVTAGLIWVFYIMRSLNLFIAVPAALGIYILSLFLTKLIKLQDVNYFRQFNSLRS